MPRDCLRIIESKSKVRNSRNKTVVAKVSLSSSTPCISPDVTELKDMVKALLLEKKNQTQAPTPVKAVEESCVTCGGAHSYRNCPATDGNVYRDNVQEFVTQAAAANFNQGNTSYRAPLANQIRPPESESKTFSKHMNHLTDMLSKFVNSNTASTLGLGTLPSNTITNPKVDLKGITTRSGVAYQRPTIPTTSSPPKVVEREPEVTKDTVLSTNNGSTKDVQPPVVQVENQKPNSEHAIAPVSAPMPNPKPSISYPSRHNDERRREKANDQVEKFYKIFQDMSFKIIIADALILMPKFASTLKALIETKKNYVKWLELSLNEHCYGRAARVRIVSVRSQPKLPKQNPRWPRPRINHYVRGGEHILSQGPYEIIWVALIMGNLLDMDEGSVRGGEKKNKAFLLLSDQSPALMVTFNLDQTSRYSSNYDDMTANRIDVIEMACEKYSQEVLGFSDVIASGNPTPYYDPIVSTSSSTLTPFGDSDFLLEEVNAFLALEDDPTLPEVDDSYYDPERDILLLEAFLNDDPSLPPPTQGNYLPEIRKELKVCEAKNDKSLIDEPPEVKLKDLPPHLEYAFLEGDDMLRVIIAKDLSVEEKATLKKVLKSHKRAIA
ncbi:hypothetical protein Tco_1523772 [Tanacetum coccineum]